MSCFDVQILDPNINTIEIETCIGDQPASIDILTYDNTSLIEVNHCVALLPSEINDLITVKDILPGSGINITDSSGIYTVSLSNPSISATGIVDLLETVQDIIGQSGLIPGNYITINYDDNTGFTTISSTGLQPSGNYSVVGHTHTSSHITDFDSSVSGLLPVKNITAGSGIGILSSSGNFTVSVTGTFGLTSEEVDDRVSNLLIAGTGINLNYNDLANSLSISTTGLQPSGNYSLVGHTHTSSQITDFNTAVSGLIPINTIVGKNGIQINTVSGTTREISTNFIAGNGIAFNYNNDESLTINTITNNGLISINDNSTTLITIPSGYIIGSLSIYQNGVKLLDSIDYTATDGSGVILNIPPSSGSYIEYATPTINSNIQNLINASLSGLQPSGNYSIVGHTHISNEITNFSSSVSGLLPTISGSGYVLSSFANNIYTISVSGLQPSGNYSTVGHTHTANNITDFNNSVSGLIPSVSGSGYVVSSLSNNIYSISVTGLQPSGNYSTVGHSHTTTDISNISTIYDTYIYDLGTLSGSVDINYATDRMIQTFNIDNNPITLTKGTGWPTSNISRDVLLQITCINPASITWSIVGNNWYNQPALSLPSGEYMVLLRAMGSGVIQGHYIGEKQGVL